MPGPPLPVSAAGLGLGPQARKLPDSRVSSHSLPCACQCPRPAQDNYATNNTNLITISQYPNNATTIQLTGMAYKRGFHTTVVTPGGQIYVFGGQVREPWNVNI